MMERAQHSMDGIFFSFSSSFPSSSGHFSAHFVDYLLLFFSRFFLSSGFLLSDILLPIYTPICCHLSDTYLTDTCRHE